MDLMKYAEESSGLKVPVDMYGGRPNKGKASKKAKSMGLGMPFHGPIDSAKLGFTHKIFINPSLLVALYNSCRHKTGQLDMYRAVLAGI